MQRNGRRSYALRKIWVTTLTNWQRPLLNEEHGCLVLLFIERSNFLQPVHRAGALGNPEHAHASRIQPSRVLAIGEAGQSYRDQIMESRFTDGLILINTRSLHSPGRQRDDQGVKRGAHSFFNDQFLL